MLSLLLSGIFTWIIYYIINYYRWVAKYPKGPTPLPLLGNIHQIDRRMLFLDIERYANEYGNIFTIFIPIPFVVIADYDTLKEAFVVKGDDFIGRPNDKTTDLFSYCKEGGVINTNGQIWKEQRRNALSILRDFGMGRNLMEQKVQQSIEEYLKYLDNIHDKSRVDLRLPIQVMVSNIICETIFGFRYAYDDCQELMDYVAQFNKLMKDITDSVLVFFALRIPLIEKIPVIGYNALGKHIDNMEVLRNFIRKQVKRTTSNYEPDSDPTCFVDAYRKRMPHNEWLTEDQLHACCSDFFLAGQETTTTTLRWAMLYLAEYQDIQDKLREEVLSVVGTSRLPSMSDKANMPYTSAAVLEIQRHANILAFNVMHRTVVDTEVNGTKIPADTFVNGDIHFVMANDPMFVNPKEFNPSRFLNADGMTLKKDLVDRCVAFSVGRRQCAGEAMARVELFLGLASTIQHYKIHPPLDKPLNLEPIYNTFHIPQTNLLQLIRVTD